MPWPSPHVETAFAQGLHALPAAWAAMRRAQGALPPAGTLPPPAALRRALWRSGGPDPSVRAVAGTRTLRTERSTAQAVWPRLQRCPPCLPALIA